MLTIFKKLQTHILKSLPRQNKIACVQLETSEHFSSKKNHTKSAQKHKSKSFAPKKWISSPYDHLKAIDFNDDNSFNEKKFTSFESEAKYRHNQAKRSLMFKLDTNSKEVTQSLIYDLNNLKCSVQDAFLLGK